MNEEVEVRQTQIVDEQTDLSKREEIKEEVFDTLKLQFIEQQRLLGRFYEFSSEHAVFEYDETGDNYEEGDEILRKANKIRDKLLSAIEQNCLYIFQNVETNTLTNMISFDIEKDGERFRIIIEVFENSFNLEVI